MQMSEVRRQRRKQIGIKNIRDLKVYEITYKIVMDVEYDEVNTMLYRLSNNWYCL
jgi:hypothetical protein